MRINPALQKAGVSYRSAWRSVLGTSYEWVFVSPIPKFSQFDEPGRVQVAADVSEKLSECHAERMVSAAMFQADLSKAPAASYRASTAIVTTFRIAPGKMDEYRELAKDYILPAMERIGAPGYQMDVVRQIQVLDTELSFFGEATSNDNE